MLFTVNDSPLTGEGQFLTSRHLKERLDRELQSNVALRVEPTEERDSFMVSGRGLLHLSVLIETMRREGYELAVGKPEVILKRINGVEHEPYEYLVVDVPHGQMGPVMELVGARRGEMIEDGREGGLRPPRVHDPRPRPARPAEPPDERHAGRGDHAPQLPRLPAVPGRDPPPRQRRDDQHGQRPGRRLRPRQPPAARDDVRPARRRHLRRA